MHIFKRVETLIALDLIDLIGMVNVELVASKNGDGRNLLEGEQQNVCVGFDLHTGSVKCKLHTLVQRLFPLVRNDLAYGNTLSVHRHGVIGAHVKSVDKIGLCIVPLCDKAIRQIKADAFKRGVLVIDDLTPALAAGKGFPVALKGAQATEGTNVKRSFDIFSTLLVTVDEAVNRLVDVQALANDGEQLVVRQLGVLLGSDHA